MGRLVRTDSPSTERHRLRRTVAEALNRLVRKESLDDETRDLAALIVLALREVDANIERSAAAWDDRHYYVKADRLRADWAWCARSADRMANLIVGGDWARLPVVLADLAPRFADIKVTRLTRSAELWDGAYARLLATERDDQPTG